MTSTLHALVDAIAAALSERSLANAAPSDDDQYAKHSVEQLARGVDNYADNIPAVDKRSAGGVGWDMEAARLAGMADQRQHRKAVGAERRKRTQLRREAFEEVAARPTAPNPERMAAGWSVVAHLLPIVDKIATEKRQWAVRFLGSITDDLTQVVVEKLALVLAKGDWDLAVMAEAAAELGDETQRTNRIPGNQGDEERTHRKALRRARKELMSMVNYWTLTTLVDLYREARNLRWENLDLLATVADAVSGVGGDPLTAHTKADRAPAMLGTSFQRPGGLDPALVAQAINGAITDRRLDRLTELLLDEGNRRTDGSFKWRELAEQVFRSTADGTELWPDVERVTASMEVPGRARAAAARRHTRQMFAWLPGFIIDLVEAFDARPIGMAHGRVVCASDFESYRLDPDPMGERRLPLRPALTYGSATDAARALVAGLTEAVTGEEFVRSIQYA